MVQNISHGEIDLGTRVVPYRVVPSTRARSLRLRIGPRPEVTIVVPHGRAIRDVAEILLPARDWILRQVEKLERNACAPLVSGARLPYLGKEYRVVLKASPSPRTALRDDQLVVSIPPDGSYSARDVLEVWYRWRARDILTERVRHFEGAMGVQHAKITVRDQKTRWGSCSSRGNLNFNWRLVMAPLAVIDYVVVHELAHLIELNHSPRFWETVERHCPDHREHRRWLGEHSSRLALVLTSPPT